MKVILQRVSQAQVIVENEIIGKIGHGYLLLVGIAQGDEEKDLDWMAKKIKNLRVFEDENQKMNLDITQVKGEILAVSQFTLFANCSKGNRPSFTKAASPDEAQRLFQCFVDQLKLLGLSCQTGKFRAEMQVSLINQGPVTISLDSKND
jgi:D-tyrosyl-tRNA(Tyr) deacylase